MDWITILAMLGILVGAGIVFGTGCSIGRMYAAHELAVVRVRCQRLEKDKIELQRRLTEYRGDYYAIAKIEVVEELGGRPVRRIIPREELEELAPVVA